MIITNKQRQHNYLISKGFKYEGTTNSYFKGFDKIGIIVVDARTMNCLYIPNKPVYYSTITLREIWDELERVNTDLDHLKINGID